MTMVAPAIQKSRKRFLLAARYYSIEPLGILYLAGKIRDMGWECKVELVREFDFEPLYETAKSWNPDLVGFQIWTGYHLPAFAACDRIRAMGYPVTIGGPHATYAHVGECLKHADWVIQGMGFELFGKLLEGELKKGSYFDPKGREDPFPLPDREIVYERYPELGASPIKSMFASVGCPFHCSYCYAPAFNKMHEDGHGKGGFKFITGNVDRLITEAHQILERRPLAMVYFQDDIFGFEYKKWLPEFARRWSREVGVPFHAQARLELIEGDAGERRLDLFKEAGCTGITLAIESGKPFLRDRVLMRHMPDELIVEGCEKIMDRGLTLRTEQILAVPFSDTGTDLLTLDLNNRINPDMAWTSILAPYLGTDMGTIARAFGFYDKNNDDLADSFFDASVLRHPAGGPRDIEPIVENLGVHPKAKPELQPLVNMRAVRNGGQTADVFYQAVTSGKIDGVTQIVKVGEPQKVGTLEYLSEQENKRYCDATVRLQRLFNFLAKVPDGEVLARKLLSLPQTEWKWGNIGEATAAHLRGRLSKAELLRQKHALAHEMRMPLEDLPEIVRENPHYFCYFPAGGILAAKALERRVFGPHRSTTQSLDEMHTLARRHLFTYSLYKVEQGADPIASL